MKTLKTMLRSYLSKYKTRDLIMSGVLVAVIIAYGWDEDDTTTLPAYVPVPQQQYFPAPQAPAQPQAYSYRQPIQVQQAPQQTAQPHPYSQLSNSGQPDQAIRNQHEKFMHVQPDYQRGRYPTTQAPNTYPGQTMRAQRPAY